MKKKEIDDVENDLQNKLKAFNSCLSIVEEVNQSKKLELFDFSSNH